MFPVTSQVARVLPQATRTIIPMRTSVISGPPKIRLSLPEKLLCGGLLGISILGVPAWVLVNLKHYAGKPE